MNYKNKNFYIEGVSAEKISKNYGTPTYCYSINKLKQYLNRFI